jgi:hypothetical protein
MKTGIIAARYYRPQTSAAFITAGAVAFATLFTSGCTHFAKTRSKTAAQLEEHSRALTSGIVDVLHLQPTERRDAFTDVALQLAQEDQRIEGLPLEPIAVGALVGIVDTNVSPVEAIAQRAVAREEVAKRITEARGLLAKNRRAEERLVAFGEQFEQTRNEQRVRWFKRGTIVTVVLGGLIALAFFVPASIPILGRILAFCVGRFPAFAGTAGVVSVKAFDAVVKGIERMRNTTAPAVPSQFGNQIAGGSQSAQSAQLAELQSHLSIEMDAAHKALVRERKAALKLDR